VDDEAERASYADRYRRQLIKALEQCGSAALHLRPEPNHLVHLLFRYLVHGCGEEAARQMFIAYDKQPSEMTDIRNSTFLDSYDREMKLQKESGREFVEAQFLRACVKANKSLPFEEQRGAGGTDFANLRKHLGRLLKERNLQHALAGRGQAARELSDLRRVREGAIAAGEGNLTMIRDIDRRCETLRAAIATLDRRIAHLQSSP
jgi:hypothetical protein